MKRKKHSIDALYLRQFRTRCRITCTQAIIFILDQFIFNAYGKQNSSFLFFISGFCNLDVSESVFFRFRYSPSCSNWIEAICGSMAITLFRIRIELWWWMRFYGLHREWTEHNIILCIFFPVIVFFSFVFLVCVCLSFTDGFVVVTFCFLLTVLGWFSLACDRSVDRLLPAAYTNITLACIHHSLFFLASLCALNDWGPVQSDIHSSNKQRKKPTKKGIRCNNL